MGIGSVKVPGAAMDRQREPVQREKTVQQEKASRQGKTTPQKAAQPVDAVSRNIQNEISEVQRQKQGLSSKREMPADERSEKKQELQHELSTLNTRLRQRQTEVQREQNREGRSEELSAEDTKEQKSRIQAEEEKKAVPVAETAEKRGTEKSPDGETGKESIQAVDPRGVKENIRATSQKSEKERGQGVSPRDEKENRQTVSPREEKDKAEKPGGTDFTRDELHSVAAGSIAKEQTRRRNAVISRMEGGIVLLRGEIRQDELRGGSADGKRAELKARQEKLRNAASGIPAIKGPSAKKDEMIRKPGGIRAETEPGEVKRSLDGVVVITQNAPWNQIG